MPAPGNTITPIGNTLSIWSFRLNGAALAWRFEIGLKARVTQRGDQGVKDVRDGANDDLGVGEWPWVGLVLEGAVAIELEFGEDVIGGG